MIRLTLDDKSRLVAMDLPYLTELPHRKFLFLDGTAGFQVLKNDFQTAGIPRGTEFQMAVWRELKKIPRGQTRTYGQIAAAVGRPKAARAVGSACGKNPIPVFIPCHRAVASNGLGGFSGGLPWKKLLLELENARF